MATGHLIPREFLVAVNEKKFIHRDKSRERSSRGGLYYFLSGRRIVGEFMDSEGK